MNYFSLITEQQEWKDRVAVLTIGDRAAAAEYDRLARYTRASLAALQEAKPRASRAPREHGGLGVALVTVYLIVEEIAKKCPSTTIGYKMRLEATELLFPLTNAIQNLTGKETLPCPIFAWCSHLLLLSR